MDDKRLGLDERPIDSLQQFTGRPVDPYAEKSSGHVPCKDDNHDDTSPTEA